jgi:hypothetical protein
MPANLSILVSKIRYELLNTSKEVKYVNSLFRYFNTVYGELNAERNLELNPAGELKNKNEFSKASNAAINSVFEQVFRALKENKPVERNASPEFMMLYALGFEVQYQMGELNEMNKTDFLKQLITQYNHDFHSNFTSLEDFMLNKKTRKDYDTSDDY